MRHPIRDTRTELSETQAMIRVAATEVATAAIAVQILVGIVAVGIFVLVLNNVRE